MGGCVPPYKPNRTADVNSDTNVTVNSVKASVAFDTYKKETAANFRQLAKNCADGTYEYVSELVDAAVQLDKTAKTKRNKPIDSIISKELGDSKLDAIKAVKVLNDIADDLDPNGSTVPADNKTSMVMPKATVSTDWINGVTDFDYSVGEKALAKVAEQLKSPVITKVSRTVYCTQNELLDKCVNSVTWSVDGDVYSHLINEHGFTQKQIDGLTRRQCHILHSNAHNGIVKPTKVIME